MVKLDDGRTDNHLVQSKLLKRFILGVIERCQNTQCNTVLATNVGPTQSHLLICIHNVMSVILLYGTFGAETVEGSYVFVFFYDEVFFQLYFSLLAYFNTDLK